MFKQKSVIVSLALALTVSGVAGCAQKTEPQAAGTAGTGGEKVTLRFMSWDSGATLAPYQRAIDAFMKKYPDITVKTESVPDNFDQKLLTSLASNTAPDVFMTWNYPKFVPSGALEPLDEYIKNDKLDMGIYYDIINKYVQFDGKTWGLPTTYSTRAIYYNKKLFDAAGVPYPKDGWSWNDFSDTVKKLTKPGQYGFISTPDDFFTMQPYFWSNKGDLISQDGKKIDSVFNSAQNVQTVKFLKDLYDISAKQASAGKFSTNNGLEAFKTGSVAMFDNGMWPIGDILKEGKLELGIVSHPVPQNGTLKSMIHTSGYTMPKSGKHKKEAWELVKFMSGPEGSKLISDNKFAFSPVKAVDKELNYAADPLFKPFALELQNSDITMAYTRNANWDKAEAIMKQAVQEMIINNKDIQSTLDKAAKDAEAALK
jgi:multiple sugar transport system substrate-binding protein